MPGIPWSRSRYVRISFRIPMGYENQRDASICHAVSHQLIRRAQQPKDRPQKRPGRRDEEDAGRKSQRNHHGKSLASRLILSFAQRFCYADAPAGGQPEGEGEHHIHNRIADIDGCHRVCAHRPPHKQPVHGCIDRHKKHGNHCGDRYCPDNCSQFVSRTSRGSP